MAYSSQTISGYNSSPPDDDGSETEANRVTWAKIKTKITDPIKTLAESINTAMVSHAATRFGNTVETFSTTKTFDGNDEGSVQAFTGSSNTTATLPSAATVGSGWVISVVNNGTAILTIDGDGSETINGSLTKTLSANQSAILSSDGSNWYLLGTDPDLINPTGMVSPFMLSSAPSGWLALNRQSIGDTSTSADSESADNENLFISLHGTHSDTEAPVLEASAGWQTVESVDTGNDELDITGHNLSSNTKVVLLDSTGSSTAPGGLLFNVVYYVVSSTADAFSLSASSGPGAAINITSAGTGTFKIAEVSKATAQADWDAGKIMVLPDFRGRSVIGTGTGEDGTGVAELTARSIGERDGAETHTLTQAEMPSHYHLLVNDSNSSSSLTDGGARDHIAGNGNGGALGTDYKYELAGVATTPDIGRSDTAGSGSDHNNMSPWAAALWCIKK